MQRGRRQWRETDISREEDRKASGMTGSAIRITTKDLDEIRRHVLAVGSLMLMRMVTEVLSYSSGFMLAIAGRRRPTELQRHEYQQKDSQPFAHRVNSVAATGTIRFASYAKAMRCDAVVDVSAAAGSAANRVNFLPLVGLAMIFF